MRHYSFQLAPPPPPPPPPPSSTPKLHPPKAAMTCFGLSSLFRRSKSTKQHHSLASQQPHPSQPSSSFHAQAQRIAQIPVSGISRTHIGTTSSYLPTSQAVHPRGPYATGRDPANFGGYGRVDTFSTVDSTGDTLLGSNVDLGKKGGYGGQESDKGAWQGKPNGTPYDRREELTEEDEDMWARMAM